jgi:hypothetical protein
MCPHSSNAHLLELQPVRGRRRGRRARRGRRFRHRARHLTCTRAFPTLRPRREAHLLDLFPTCRSGRLTTSRRAARRARCKCSSANHSIRSRRARRSLPVACLARSPASRCVVDWSTQRACSYVCHAYTQSLEYANKDSQKGPLDICLQTVRKEGFFALYKGSSSPPSHSRPDIIEAGRCRHGKPACRHNGRECLAVRIVWRRETVYLAVSRALARPDRGGRRDCRRGEHRSC